MRRSVKDIIAAVGGIGSLILLVLFVFLIGPLALVWAMNLLGFDVPFTFKTLLGAFILIVTLGGGSRSNKK